MQSPVKACVKVRLSGKGYKLKNKLQVMVLIFSRDERFVQPSVYHASPSAHPAPKNQGALEAGGCSREAVYSWSDLCSSHSWVPTWVAQ